MQIKVRTGKRIGQAVKDCCELWGDNQKDNVGDRERNSKRETEREGERQCGVREIRKDTRETNQKTKAMTKLCQSTVLKTTCYDILRTKSTTGQ
jgi:hypothetical protein